MHIANTFIPRDNTAQIDLTGAHSVTLALAQRRRSRQRLRLDGSDIPVAMAIDRGITLRDGDVLATQQGQHIVIRAALEDVARVSADTPWQLARAAYHLGNRHILVEIAEGYLQFEYDAVLVDMLAQLGDLSVERIKAAFEPDVGAYGGGHRHGHDETFEEDYALAQAAFHVHHHSDRNDKSGQSDQ